MNAAAFRHHARFIKTFDHLAFRDLLLHSCKPKIPPSTLFYITTVFNSHTSFITDTFPYNTMIRSHSLHPSNSSLALSFFDSMHRNAIPFDSYTFPFLLKACTHHPSRSVGLSMGLVAHAIVVKLGFLDLFVHVGNALAGFYAGFGFMGIAVKVFEKMPVRDVVSWAAVIGGFVDNGLNLDAVLAFRMMQGVGDVEMDAVTMIEVITAVGNLGVPELAVWIYSFVRRRKFDLTVSLGTALVVMLSRCGHVNYARNVFDNMTVRNMRTWTALVFGLAEHGRGNEAIGAFDRMVEEGFVPDHVTFIGVLTACSHGGLLGEGLRLFESIQRDYGMVPCMEHYGCVVDMFGRAGRIDDASEFINKMPVEPNTVIWRTLLGACVNCRRMDLAEYVKEKITELEPGHDGDHVLLSNVFGGTENWSEKTKIRASMKDQGIKKTPGWSAHCV